LAALAFITRRPAKSRLESAPQLEEALFAASDIASVARS
jgi:hypothetical protein